MRAKEKFSVNENRHKLQEEIPLNTPYTAWIDVCSICNFRCKFCAVQNDKKTRSFRRGLMEYSLFQNCIDQMRDFPEKLKILRITGIGEPLLNKDFSQMIRYAKESGCAEKIETVSNGSMLTPELSDAIVEAGLDSIRFSIEAPDLEGYLKIGGVLHDWNKFIEGFKYLYAHKKQLKIYMKVVDASVDTEEKKELFYHTFGECCDQIAIEHISPVWPGYEKVNEDFDIQEVGVHEEGVKEIKICPDPFYSFIIHEDGSVGVCCSDWERVEIIGNIKDTRITKIWMGGDHRTFLETMLTEGRRHCNKACSKCEYPNYRVIDYIDPYAEIILSKIKEG